MPLDYEERTRIRMRALAEKVGVETPQDRDAEAIGQLFTAFCDKIDDPDDPLFQNSYSLLELLISLGWISPAQYVQLQMNVSDHGIRLQKIKYTK